MTSTPPSPGVPGSPGPRGSRRSAARPSLALLGTEPWRAAAEYLSNRRMRLPAHTPGNGHPVLIFPGLASDGHAVAPLRAFCQRLGYAAMDWGRGFNTGPGADLDAWLAQLADDMRVRMAEMRAGMASQAAGPGPTGAAAWAAAAADDGPPVTLIGWSLGGLYARELAKLGRLPVRQVITIGTPFNGTPDQTHAGWVFRLLNRAAPPLEQSLLQRLAAPPPVPTTSIYSRSDGVVAWQACRHAPPVPPWVQDVEVQGSHLGMGWNPQVLRVVADCLARPPAAGRAAAASGAAEQQHQLVEAQ